MDEETYGGAWAQTREDSFCIVIVKVPYCKESSVSFEQNT
jgi:hypothetical protein